jgi:HAD superfamily hydrolase (TIGR01450 family)
VTPPLRGSEQPLVDCHDAFFFDLDGVLYVGPDAVPGAAEALAELHARRCAVAYVTNNASRTPETVAAHLTELGIAAEPGEVVTSAQAVAALLADALPSGAPVLVIGGEGLHRAVEARGLRPVSAAADQPAAVVQGFGPEVGWRALAEGTYAVSAGVPWYASNLDATVPTAHGTAPGNGALVDVIAGASGRRPDVVAGKPERALFDEAVARTRARRPLMVGDRLDTDIEFANRAGTDSLLVLTGVTRLGELLRAPGHLRPTHMAERLTDGLFEPVPAVAREDGEWRCGGWTVAVRDGQPALEGAGTRVDALRALSAAVWDQSIDVRDQAVSELEKTVRASTGA